MFERVPWIAGGMGAAFALSLAKISGFSHLSGDRVLRELAGTEEVACHGVMWVPEQMQADTVRPIQILHDVLTVIGDDPRCRQPRHYIARLLAAFFAAFSE